MISHEERAISLKYLAQIGLGADKIERILGLEPSNNTHVAVVTEQELAKRCNMLVATQALLLSAYTPDSMKRWYMTPRKSLNGLTPLKHLEKGPESIGEVLLEAHRTIM